MVNGLGHIIEGVWLGLSDWTSISRGIEKILTVSTYLGYIVACVLIFKIWQHLIKRNIIERDESGEITFDQKDWTDIIIIAMVALIFATPYSGDWAQAFITYIKN